jgi:hypothetical protein
MQAHRGVLPKIQVLLGTLRSYFLTRTITRMEFFSRLFVTIYATLDSAYLVDIDHSAFHELDFQKPHLVRATVDRQLHKLAGNLKYCLAEAVDLVVLSVLFSVEVPCFLLSAVDYRCFRGPLHRLETKMVVQEDENGEEEMEEEERLPYLALPLHSSSVDCYQLPRSMEPDFDPQHHSSLKLMPLLQMLMIQACWFWLQ